VSIEAVAQATTANVERLFNLPVRALTQQVAA
jgi:hypothetical protein